MTTKQVKIEDSYKLWQQCKYNPISDISFEFYKDGIITFRKTTMRFLKESETTYYFSDVTGTSDIWYTEPVEDIKSLLPESKHHNILYYYTLFGILIILRGSFYEFPMDRIMSYFNIEKISSDSFALYGKRHKRNLKEISDYLKEAAKSL